MAVEAVALNVNVIYISSLEPGVKLIAASQEISRTEKMADVDAMGAERRHFCGKLRLC